MQVRERLPCSSWDSTDKKDKDAPAVETAGVSLSKNAFFDRLAEVKEATKISKTNPSAYKGTLGVVLRSKSK